MLLLPTATTRNPRMIAPVHDVSETLSEIVSPTMGTALPLREYDGPLIRPTDPALANERAVRAGPNSRLRERLCSIRRWWKRRSSFGALAERRASVGMRANDGRIPPRDRTG